MIQRFITSIGITITITSINTITSIRSIVCVTKFLLRLPYAVAMDPSYFEPTKSSAKILTAPTGWRYSAELCTIQEASTN